MDNSSQDLIDIAVAHILKHRREIIAVGESWVHRNSAKTAPPEVETEALLNLIFEGQIKSLQLDDDSSSSQLIQAISQLPTQQNFQISTILRGIRGVCAGAISSIEESDFPTATKNDLVKFLEPRFEESVFQLSDHYVSKLEDKLAEQEKSQEFELEQSRAATEKASAAKSEFLAHMEHELRNPLNAIMGFAQLLDEDSGLDERQQEAVQKINSSGTHLLLVINDVLDMSKIEAGTFEFAPKPTNLPDLGNSIVDLFLDQAQEKELNLSFQYESKQAPWGNIDDGKLRQVIVNLVDNAVKFTNQGSVTLHWGDCDCGQAHCHLVVVEDTGLGISEEDQSKLFEAFVQARRESSSYEGTGLGLAISRQIVELMGGKLSMNSVPEEGSRFFFHVPIPPAQEQKSISSASPDPEKHIIGKILIVDDQSENRLLLRRCVHPICYQIEEAEDGREAIEMCQIFAPDLILMDKRMPNLNGYEAAEAIKTSLGDSAPKIFIVTADPLSGAPVPFVDRSISKPIDVSEVRSIILDAFR